MRKINLISLGAWAQREFDMKPDFTVVEYPSDIGETVQIACPNVIESYLPVFTLPAEFDEVKFELMGNSSGEFMWVAYSRRANVLAIKEA